MAWELRKIDKKGRQWHCYRDRNYLRLPPPPIKEAVREEQSIWRSWRNEDREVATPPGEEFQHECAARECSWPRRKEWTQKYPMIEFKKALFMKMGELCTYRRLSGTLSPREEYEKNIEVYQEGKGWTIEHQGKENMSGCLQRGNPSNHHPDSTQKPTS